VGLWNAAPLAANTAGFFLGLSTSYVLNSRSTWKGRAGGGKRQALRFGLVTLAGLGINLGAVAAAQAMGFSWWLGMLSGIGFGAVFNFAAHELWTFRPCVETAHGEDALPLGQGNESKSAFGRPILVPDAPLSERAGQCTQLGNISRRHVYPPIASATFLEQCPESKLVAHEPTGTPAFFTDGGHKPVKHVANTLTGQGNGDGGLVDHLRIQ
jgi:hypothetical protein